MLLRETLLNFLFRWNIQCASKLADFLPSDCNNFFFFGGGGVRFFIEISQTCFVMVIFGTGDVNDLAIHSIVKVRS